MKTIIKNTIRKYRNDFPFLDQQHLMLLIAAELGLSIAEIESALNEG